MEKSKEKRAAEARKLTDELDKIPTKMAAPTISIKRKPVFPIKSEKPSIDS